MKQRFSLKKGLGMLKGVKNAIGKRGSALGKGKGGASSPKAKPKPRALTKAVIRSLLRVLTHLEEVAFDEQGLYRRAGDIVEQDRVTEELAEGAAVLELARLDVHILSCAVKKCLRDKFEPVIPYDRYQDFLDAGTDVQRLRGCMNRLPQPNLDFLKAILAHLFVFSLNSERHGMNASNLGVIFGVNLLRPVSTDKEDPVHLQESVRVRWRVGWGVDARVCVVSWWWWFVGGVLVDGWGGTMGVAGVDGSG